MVLVFVRWESIDTRSVSFVDARGSPWLSSHNRSETFRLIERTTKVEESCSCVWTMAVWIATEFTDGGRKLLVCVDNGDMDSDGVHRRWKKVARVCGQWRYG